MNIDKTEILRGRKMRWYKPVRGDTIIKKKFAILPIEINNEVRWLEWVTVKYEFINNQVIKYKGEWCKATGWIMTEFIDENNI